MKVNPRISRIVIYPVKSLDGVDLQKAMITEGGCLLHDREFAVTDENGKFVNGKSNILVHSLRSSVDFENDTISFRHQNENDWNVFHYQKEIGVINFYLSEFFGIPVYLKQNKNGRFLDIPDISGVTVLSTESLRSVSGWFSNMNLSETRKRFRASIEIEGVPAFWEDKLFLKEGTAVKFKAGDVSLLGISPRARCVVPTRHPENGEVHRGFQKTFSNYRRECLPEWSTLSDYGHFYFLSVDCLITDSETGKWIKVGDEIVIEGEENSNVPEL
jgi:uncharacterized protein YcbX